MKTRVTVTVPGCLSPTRAVRTVKGRPSVAEMRQVVYDIVADRLTTYDAAKTAATVADLEPGGKERVNDVYRWNFKVIV